MATLGNSLANGLGASLGFSLNGGNSEAGMPLDDLAAAPVGLYSLASRMLTSYAGPCCIVRRAADSAEHTIEFVAATGLPDLADLASFCAGDNGFVKTIFDQSGNGRDITMATTTKQPKCYDSVSGAVLLDGRWAATFDNAGGATNDELSRADALGLSGATALSVWSVWKTTSVSQAGEYSIGTVAAGALLEQYTNGVDTQVAVSIGGARRNFTVPDVNNQTNSTIARIGAGAQVGTAKLMHNGAECSEASSVNPTNTLNLGTTYTDAVSGARRTIPLEGPLSVLVFWGVDLSAGDLAIINAAKTTLFG